MSRNGVRKLPDDVPLDAVARGLARFGALKDVIRELRRLAIVEDCKNGKSYRQIAVESGYSERQVIRLASTLAGTVEG